MSKHVFYVGDALTVLKRLPSETVHCVVTSPPYWGLRDYGMKSQIGLERTPYEYVGKMVQVFREVRRVLRHDGTLWLNLGDSYASGMRSAYDDDRHKYAAARAHDKRPPTPHGLKAKDLLGIPWMVAFALRDDGWWLRSDIVWSKRNPLPESVRDRPTKSHEYVFLLAKSQHYFYDAYAIREPLSVMPHAPGWKTFDVGLKRHDRIAGGEAVNRVWGSATGRNKRSVWIIPTSPFPGSHFATFPEALVEPCILAGTSERGCCPKCGAPWERVVEHRRPEGTKPKKIDEPWNSGTGLGPHTGYRGSPLIVDLGWRPTCSCAISETVPCTILDPFGGSGTVSLVAKRLGRNSIYIDINPDYCDMAIRRLEPEKQPLFEPCEVRREVIA